MRRFALNLLVAVITTVVFVVVAELVLRARWEPRARTLAPFVKTRTITPEYNVEYVTNGQGFRDTDHMDSFNRVAVIGDSFIFGSGVAQEHLLTTRLQKLLWHVPVLADVHNFGVPGTGPFNAIYLWRDHVHSTRPHIVVVALYAGNDAADALRESREETPRFVAVAKAKMLWWRVRAWWQNRKHADPKDNVQAQLRRRTEGWNAFGIENPATLDRLLDVARKRGVPTDSIRVRYDAIPDTLVTDALAFRSNPFNLADAVLDPDGLRHNLLLDTATIQQGWDALETALAMLNAQVKQEDAKLVLVCIPAAVQVDSTYWWLKNLGVRLDDRVLGDTEFQDRLAKFAAREKIALIDLLPAMRAHPEERLYYEQDGHWNEVGHDTAARAIAARIEPMLPVLPAPVPADTTGRRL